MAGINLIGLRFFSMIGQSGTDIFSGWNFKRLISMMNYGDEVRESVKSLQNLNLHSYCGPLFSFFFPFGCKSIIHYLLVF